MDRNRKLLISILALLVLSSVIAIVDITMNMQQKRGMGISMPGPQVGPGVGIVRIEGPIQMVGAGSPLGGFPGAEMIIRRLNELEQNSDIRAIVIRINSPGGTVSATQEIYQKLWRLRKKNIPLIASMGEIAASGGYYIASACNVIVANHGTITGSIGVIAMSPNLRGLFEKLGISMTVIKSGRYKDILSTFREISPEERQLIQEIIDSSYRKFLKDVALGRNMNESDIEPVADGRVMGGETALKYKLVDMLGTLEDALDKARQMAKLSEDAPVYDQLRSPLEQLLFDMGARFSSPGITIPDPRGLQFENSYRVEYRCVQ
jgi:protease IV